MKTLLTLIALAFWMGVSAECGDGWDTPQNRENGAAFVAAIPIIMAFLVPLVATLLEGWKHRGDEL